MLPDNAAIKGQPAGAHPFETLDEDYRPYLAGAPFLNPSLLLQLRPLEAQFNKAALIEDTMKTGARAKDVKYMFRDNALSIVIPLIMQKHGWSVVNALNYDDYIEQAAQLLRPHFTPQDFRRKLNTIELIKQAAEKGVRLEDLQATYKRKFFANIMNIIANNHRRLFRHYYGPPGSKQNILLDECMPPVLTPIVHQLFGRISDVYSIGKQGMKDPKLFPYAAEQGYSAIFTVDAHSKKPNDMTNVAKTYYKRVADGEDIPRAPGLVVMSWKKEVAIEQLENKQDEVRTYLAEETHDFILDIR